MTLNLKIPNRAVLKPSITVFGVGGAGGNAVNNMISQQLEGISFVIANTDAQAMDNSLAQHRIQLGETITQGLGAGSYPEVGRASAEEAQQEILEAIKGSNMLFVTAGMGGGTGTGAAPVIARLAHEQGILTVAVVTKPFHFEGSHRMRVAEQGLNELQKHVDTLIVIPNQNLFRVVDRNTTFADAFKMADNVLMAGVRGVTDLMMMPGLINLDFADVRSVMSEMGRAMMGTGEASGENRAQQAAEAAISNPLLDNASMKGARGVLINITGGPDLTLFEVDEAANRIREEVDPDANIIFGSTFNKELEGKIRVSVVATGIDHEAQGQKPGSIGMAGPGFRTSAAPVIREKVVEPIVPVLKQPSYMQQPAQTAQTPVISSAELTDKPVTAPVVTPASSVAESLYMSAPKENSSYTANGSNSPDARLFVTDRHSWFRQQGKAELPEIQQTAPKPQKSRSLFSRMAAMAGFTDEAPSYAYQAPQQPQPDAYAAFRQQQESRDIPMIKPVESQPQSPQSNYPEDLLDTPAYLRRRSSN